MDDEFDLGHEEHYIEEEEEEEEDEEEEGGGGGGGGINMEASTNEFNTMTLSDPQALDCPICCSPLKAPVFQCGNGHIACPSCIPKLRNKCPSCSSPIGSIRCRAIERVLESIKVTCPNTKYGCKTVMIYSKMLVHETTCYYTPCSCPVSTCNFVGSQFQLKVHFPQSHKDSAVKFLFNKDIHITLGVNDKFLILREKMFCLLFILNNGSENARNVISFNCIGPTSGGSYFYDIQVELEEKGKPLGFQNYAKCIPGRVENPPSTGFLLVPSESFGSHGRLKMVVRISGK